MLDNQWQPLKNPPPGTVEETRVHFWETPRRQKAYDERIHPSIGFDEFYIVKWKITNSGKRIPTEARIVPFTEYHRIIIPEIHIQRKAKKYLRDIRSLAGQDPSFAGSLHAHLFCRTG
jgi:hypothetical protein